MRRRIAAVRRLERSLVWRVWERMLEIEFVDRSVALAGKAFVSFFPLVIVVAAFVPDGTRSAIISTVTGRLGLRGEALTTAKDAFASADDVREATGVLGLALTAFFATSFITALQRVYLRAWRRPPTAKTGGYWRGAIWLLAVLTYATVLGGLRAVLGGGAGLGLFVIVSLGVTFGLWWFTAWFLLLGQVRARILLPTAVITGIAMTAYVASATIWMPGVVTSNDDQFGFVGVALALTTWFSGAAICILIGACAGPVLADDEGRAGALVRGGAASTLTTGARPALPPPDRVLTLRDVFQTTEDEVGGVAPVPASRSIAGAEEVASHVSDS